MKTKIQIPYEFKELYNPAWRNLVFYGGRNALKSFEFGRALLILARQYKKRILCTREIQNTIKDSVHKLLCDHIERFNFNEYVITRDSIINSVTGSDFIFKGLKHNINEVKSTEGVDICWVEEAQSVTEKSLDVLTPTVRKPGSQMWFSYNRFDELDPVHVRFVINQPPNTYKKKVNYDIAEKYGLLSKEIREEIIHDRDNFPDLYAHKWLGEPLGQSEFSAISRTDILEAMSREITDEGQIEVGVDVARMGSDRTVLWKRKGLKTLDYRIYQGKRTTEVCDLIEGFADKSIIIKVDDTGVGGGVTDELIKRGYQVVPVNFGSEPADKDKYTNLISEAWFYLKNIIKEIQLPNDRDLLMELSTRQWKQDSRGRRYIESKADYKKRGFKSPDLADACIICYYNPQIVMPDIHFI